jgi:hypothetical protein
LKSKSEILKEVFESKDYADICYRICYKHNLHKDLFQELYLILAEKPEEKIVQLYETGNLTGFIIRTLQNQYQSKDSGFKKKHVGRLDLIDVCTSELREANIVEEQNDKDFEDLFDIELEKAEHATKKDWYENNIVKGYLRAGSMHELSRQTGINSKSICWAVKNFKEKVREKKTQYEIFMAEYNPKIQLNEAVKKELFKEAQKKNIAPEKYIEKLINDKINGKS